METVRAGKPLYLIHSMQLTQFKTTRVNLFSLTWLTLIWLYSTQKKNNILIIRMTIFCYFHRFSFTHNERGYLTVL